MHYFIQVSYASTVSELSDKDKYPLLYSIVPPDSSQNGARMAFLKHFRWKRIATIRQNEYDFVEVRPITNMPNVLSFRSPCNYRRIYPHLFS